MDAVVIRRYFNGAGRPPGSLTVASVMSLQPVVSQLSVRAVVVGDEQGLAVGRTALHGIHCAVTPELRLRCVTSMARSRSRRRPSRHE